MKFLSKSPIIDITVNKLQRNLIYQNPLYGWTNQSHGKLSKIPYNYDVIYKCNMSNSHIYLISMKSFEICEIIHFEGCIFYNLFLFLKIYMEKYFLILGNQFFVPPEQFDFCHRGFWFWASGDFDKTVAIYIYMGQLQESCTVSPPHQNGLVNLWSNGVFA